jgi:AcrR family transcriptional regulator
MPRRPKMQDAPLESVARPKQARSEATLQRILEAAEALIAKKRFGAISIPEIALQAESAVGGFYSRFKDNNALLRAREERFFRRLLDRVDPEVWASSDLQGLTRGLIRELIHAADDERNLMGAILTRAATDPELRHETEQFRRDVTRRVTPLFANHAAQLRHPDPAMAMDLIVQMAFAMMLRHIASGGIQAGGRVLSNDQLEAEITRMVLAYLGFADGAETVGQKSPSD